jgi:plasmid maintenance system antidote protein VapI
MVELNLQKNYDLWQAEHTSKDWEKVKAISHKLFHAT